MPVHQIHEQVENTQDRGSDCPKAVQSIASCKIVLEVDLKKIHKHEFELALCFLLIPVENKVSSTWESSLNISSARRHLKEFILFDHSCDDNGHSIGAASSLLNWVTCIWADQLHRQHSNEEFPKKCLIVSHILNLFFKTSRVFVFLFQISFVPIKCDKIVSITEDDKKVQHREKSGEEARKEANNWVVHLVVLPKHLQLSAESLLVKVIWRVWIIVFILIIMKFRKGSVVVVSRSAFKYMLVNWNPHHHYEKPPENHTTNSWIHKVVWNGESILREILTLFGVHVKIFLFSVYMDTSITNIFRINLVKNPLVE